MRSRFMMVVVVVASMGGAPSTCGEGEALAERSSRAESSGDDDAVVVEAVAIEPDGIEEMEMIEEAVVDGAEEREHREDGAVVKEQNCPEGMAMVEGEHCFVNEQVCLRWDDPEGRPTQRVCGVFQQPTRCLGRRHRMRFCMDRDEYVEFGSRLPVVGVSWEGAKSKCEALGKRLCTNLEWEFACEGEEGLPYPYGFERSPSLCNQDRVVRDGESNARGDLREPPHASCVSPFGIRDMVGNVDEWVMRPYEKSPHRSELRGGWWMTGRNRCRAATTSHDERYSGSQTGFRCCSDAASAGRVDAVLDAKATGE
jgi:hypothetical protein